MSDFEKTLLRLKERLGITSDKGVAELLGMGEKALNARKRRGSFPEEKLKALALDRPELHLDVKYVLTGRSDELDRRMAAIKTATQIAASVREDEGRYEVQQAVFDTIVNALSTDELMLLQCFRNADDQGKQALLATAVALDQPRTTKHRTTRANSRSTKR